MNASLCASLCFLAISLSACQAPPVNNPYRAEDQRRSILYQSFAERPKHLDPAISYSENEYVFTAQIYEPPLQYHYLQRPYQLVPLTASAMPLVRYFNAQNQPLPDDAAEADIAYTEYQIDLQPGIRYQPHPALAKNAQGEYLYHHLSATDIAGYNTLADFAETGTRNLTAEDYVYQIKRLAHPKNQSPIAEIMKNYIVGFDEFAQKVAKLPKTAIRDLPMSGVTATSPQQYRIRIRGKYPQFSYWLAMQFFVPMPWEAEVFYEQPGLKDQNISLDWYPVGTGAYYLAENNPNRRMILKKNPYFHFEAYPTTGEPADEAKGLLGDAGKPLPFIEQAVFTLEKETIPLWSKFLQGYYDASGIASDNFDQAVQLGGAGEFTLTDAMQAQGISLRTTVETSIFYLGFNMLDATLGGLEERACKLRQAISIAVDHEEFIAIFRNGRGLPAQGTIPPGIFGHVDGAEGINTFVYDWQNGQAKRKPLAVAKQLLAEAGYPNGTDPKTGQPLILYFDTMAAAADDRPMLNWYRKQFAKLGIDLVVRATDYNRFQEKMRTGNAQIFAWGWNADYPDPENFLFLLYGANGKVKHGGENASNYQNPAFDRLFEKMRNMDNGDARQHIIRQMQAVLQHDAPWSFGFHPKKFALYHGWLNNLKPNLMANNQLKYQRIDAELRAAKRAEWNQPILWPLAVVLIGLVLAGLGWQWRLRHKAQAEWVGTNPP